jgi:nucleoside-diphosphate-sugar epimerase
MRALVTGATGYLGFHLCRHLLDSRWEVHALVRSTSDATRVAALSPARVHRLDSDLGNLSDIVVAASPDSIFNLAAAMPRIGTAENAEPLARLALANEILPTQLGAELAGLPDTIMVHAASWSEWDEEGNEAPATDYAASKTVGRHALEKAARTQHFRLTNLVLHDTYGPADWRGKILDHMVAAALDGRVISLTPGEQLIDLVHVSDVSEAFRLTAEQMVDQPPGEPEDKVALYAVASGQPQTLKAIGAAVEDAAGRPLKADWGAVPYRPGMPWRPGKMALPLPGWTPAVSLAEGLSELAAQHRQAAS